MNGKCLELLAHLNHEEIILTDNSDISQKQTLKELTLYIKEKLHETYPLTKLKPIVKSVHYANGFPDENLKEVVFMLDDIEQHLSINKFLNHDKSVICFNHKITADGFNVNSRSLLGVMIESLLLSKGNKNK